MSRFVSRRMPLSLVMLAMLSLSSCPGVDPHTDLYGI
jgi:hypothetical protein